MPYSMGSQGFSTYPLGFPEGYSNSTVAHQKLADQVTDLDEAAFEKAFDMVSSESQQFEILSPSKEAHLDQARSSNVESPSKFVRIGADSILDQSQKDGSNSNEAKEADELARTAGNLLETVKGDHSQKFRESNFLSLMRQVRDREVTVKGDTFVDVSVCPFFSFHILAWLRTQIAAIDEKYQVPLHGENQLMGLRYLSLSILVGSPTPNIESQSSGMPLDQPATLESATAFTDEDTTRLGPLT